MRKKRILFCGEATYLNTGYATYLREVMKVLYATQKYEIAEFASYGKDGDPRGVDIPWKFYGNLPTKDSQQQQYDEIPTNQFGEWKFESVLLDFLPDIVGEEKKYWKKLSRCSMKQSYSSVKTPTITQKLLIKNACLVNSSQLIKFIKVEVFNDRR